MLGVSGKRFYTVQSFVSKDLFSYKDFDEKGSISKTNKQINRQN